MTQPQPIQRESETTITPEFRFPEFRERPGWKKRKLNDLLFEPRKRNRQLKYGASDVLSVSGEYGCVNQIAFLGRSYAGASVKDYHIVETDDVVYTKSPLKKSPYGIIKANKGAAGIVSTLYAVYRATEKCYSHYLDHYFSRDYNLSSYLQPLVKKGPKNDMKVNNSDVLTGEIWVPEVDEQQKIAECLSTLDELIGAESQKLDALKAHKRGLTQQLFPREGETLPTRRFPEFQNAPEWSTVSLGDILTCKPEYGVNAPAVPYSDTLPTYLRITDIDDDGRFIRESKASVDISPTDENYLSEGDIVLARTGGSVGKSYRYRQSDGRLVFAGFLIRIRPNPTKADPIFVSNFLTTNQYWDWVRITSTRSGQPGLNGSEYASLQVPIPSGGKSSLAEQQRIVSCLSSFEELIAAQSDKLGALKTCKRGLMQQLFPSPAEAAV